MGELPVPREQWEALKEARDWSAREQAQDGLLADLTAEGVTVLARIVNTGSARDAQCALLLLLELHRRQDERLTASARSAWVSESESLLVQNYPRDHAATTAAVQTLYEADRPALESFLLGRVSWEALRAPEVNRYVEDLAFLSSAGAIERLKVIRDAKGVGAAKAQTILERKGVVGAGKIEEIAAIWRRERKHDALAWLYQVYVCNLRNRSLAMAELRRLLGTPSVESRSGLRWELRYDAEDCEGGQLFLESDEEGNLLGTKMR